MSLDHFTNIVSPASPDGSSCGYCSPPGQRSELNTNYHSAELSALRLTCAAYQHMIDRGWRRSGTYCYKPDLKLSCCPQYTIKLDAMAFKPSRSQRKLINRWNRSVLHGKGDEGQMDTEQSCSPLKQLRSNTSKSASFTTLSDAIHESEFGFHPENSPAHKFEVVLEPSNFTEEKVALYKKYQRDIHNEADATSKGFERFLVDSPLQYEAIPYSSPPPGHLPQKYGSYHQLYTLDGELIAMGVLDILPKCVSSVYFIYDKTFERFSMGKLSALREISLACEIREAGAPFMDSLYMGFYIHSCPKMRYKGEYAPSYLADPVCNLYFSDEVFLRLAAYYRKLMNGTPWKLVFLFWRKIDMHASHSRLNRQIRKQKRIPNLPALALAPILASNSEEFNAIKVLLRSSSGDIIAVPIERTTYLSHKQHRKGLGTCIRGLGHTLATTFYFIP